jgi:hypothetical protein
MIVVAGRVTATARADIGASRARRKAWVRGCVQEVSRQLLMRSESLAAEYWSTYIRSRWNLEVDVDSSDRELIVARFSAAQASRNCILSQEPHDWIRR